MNTLTGCGAAVRTEQKDLFTTGTGRTYNAFGDAKTHLSRFEVGHTQDQSTDEIFGLVGLGYPGEDIFGDAAQV